MIRLCGLVDTSNTNREILPVVISECSTDAGVTWETPVNIPNNVQFETLDVDSNGNVYVGGENAFAGGKWCARSSNAQIGNQTPVLDQNTAVIGSVYLQWHLRHSQ